MPVSNDPQRRPLYIDRVNRRLLSDPLGAGAWPVEALPLSSFSTSGGNVIIGRYGAAGAVQELTADVTIQLLNTATTQVIAAARVAAGSTSAAGVLQLTDSTSSTSITTAATPNAVKTAWDLASAAQASAGAAQAAASIAQGTADAALPKAGGVMTGAIAFWANQPTGTTSAAGIVQLTDSTASTSVTTAATPNSVKSAADAAAAALSRAGGAMTGDITFSATQAYPKVPQNAKTSAYTLIATDAGKHISITTGGVTVPSGVFGVGDAISIYNNSGSSQTITQGASTTVRLAGSATTGNRTLAQYGLCTILCVASNVFVVSGAGLS